VFTKKVTTTTAGQTADGMATLTVNDSEVCSVAAAAASDSRDHKQPANDGNVASSQHDSTAGDRDVTSASIWSFKSCLF